jgi:hypothetical protein
VVIGCHVFNALGDAIWAEGKAMTLDQAIVYALTEERR